MEKILFQNCSYNICVVGTGGTGTFFLKEMARYIAALPFKKRNMIQKIYLCDGDVVEEKNLSRQAFYPEDIGRNKAAVMAEVLQDAFSVSFQCIDRYLLSVEDLSFMDVYGVPILIGCVDNHACRKILEEYFASVPTCIYMDAANEYSDGECIFAVKKDGVVYAPVRSIYFPDVLTGDMRAVTEVSCEELNEVLPQHIFTNMHAALQLLAGFSSVMEKGIPLCGWSYFDTEGLSCQFTPYRGGEL